MGTRRKLALLAGATVISVIAAELMARVVFSDITTTFDNRSYFAMKWKTEHVRLNNHGFREREFTATAPPGTYRIALVGDSFGFGQGIDVTERMSSVIERELNKRGQPAEVLFFGDTGMNTADELAVLHRAVSLAKPDFVLLQWFVNDVELPTGRGDDGTGRRSRTAWDRLKLRVRNSLALYFLAANVWHGLTEDRSRFYVDEMHRRFGNPDGEGARRADAALRAFFAACRNYLVPCGVVLVPDMASLGADYPFGYLHERVLSTCAAENVGCVDLRGAFEEHGRNHGFSTLWVNRFDPHMGPSANRVAGHAVLDTFKRLWSSRGAEPGR